MPTEKVLQYASAFFEKFQDFLVTPTDLPIQPEDKNRVIISDKQAILPAREKFSDWDTYCFVDGSKITLSALGEMRDFILSWQGFDLTRDYVTHNNDHKQARAYQAVGIEMVFCMQFMAFIKGADNAPFIDIHIWGIPREMLETFYSQVPDIDETGYLDWAIITLWGKLRRTGKVDKEGSFYVRSVYAALSPEQKSSTDKDITGFLESYFKDRPAFKTVNDFLLS